jgi:hypothetical protein
MPDPTQPAITSKNFTAAPTPPKPPVVQNEVAIPYEQIVAKPLRAPNFTNLKHRNPNMSLYWGNRAVGEKESTMRYDQLLSMGFVPAKPQDVLLASGEACPPSLQRDGRVMYGDLILLMISRTDYVGQIKWNEQSARLRVKKPGVTIETGNSQDVMTASELVKDTNDARKGMTAAAFPRKVSTYVPALAETDAKTADNSGPETDFNLASKG